MIPPDSVLGLPHGALRLWAALGLSACSVAVILLAVLAPGRRGLGLGFGSGPSGRAAELTLAGGAGQRSGAVRHGLHPALAIGIVALALRALLSLVQDGGLYDVFDAYRIVGTQLRQGGDLFVEPALGLANYPPTVYWWWALASAVPADHPHLYAWIVRLPFWLADAAIAPLLMMLLSRAPAVSTTTARRAAWMYALCPVAAAVPTLHGQFDPLVVLPLLVAVALLDRSPMLAGALVGAAIAIKPWPAFFAVPLLAMIPRRRWAGFLAWAAAVPLATFAAYGLLHPAHLVAGMYRVATYVAHRQGLGTSFLLPPRAPVAMITVLNLAAGVASSVAGVVAARRGRPAAEVLSIAMLVLLAISPTVSDQYLMWPLPFLLLAVRLRLVAVLGGGLLPAVLWLNLWTSQNDGSTPVAALALATATVAGVAMWLVAEPAATRERLPLGDAVATGR